jgi:hypothetical protein
MKVGSLVQLRKGILAPEDYREMKRMEIPIPQYDAIYTVISIDSEFCEDCGENHMYVSLEELGEEPGYDADIFVEVQPPISIADAIELEMAKTV